MLVSSISTGHWSFPIQETYRMQFYLWVTRRRSRTTAGNPIQYSVFPHVPFAGLLSPPGDPSMLGDTFCSFRYSSSSLFCISNSACRSCRIRCFSISRSTPLCIDCRMISFRLAWSGGVSVRTHRFFLFLRPVHKGDDARRSKARRGQCQFRGSRHLVCWPVISASS